MIMIRWLVQAIVLLSATDVGSSMVLSAWRGPVTGREPRATWHPVWLALWVTAAVALVMS